MEGAVSCSPQRLLSMCTDYCWGGYFITTVTVQRMYALHFLLPFAVAGGLIIHLSMLHVMGSGTASTVPGTTVDGDAFLVYYYKDT